MKRFITISLLATMSVSALPCAWPGTDNYYLFCVCDKQEFRERVNRTTQENWKAYVHSDQEYYWFDADEVLNYAKQNGDILMVSYVKHLQQYLQCAEEVTAEQWEYPTKEQLAQRRQTLQNVRSYAFSKLKTRLRSQHALLYMRCNMLLGHHAENVTFWENTARQYIETVYKEMMQNIYAGALLKTGRADEAGRLFAEQGDWQSLMTQYYKQRSFAAIRQEYLRDATSPVLPFLLQDFVNNCQEAYDAVHGGEGGIQGKLFVRDIQRDEAQQMMAFAAQVVREGKTGQSAMWQTAKAWLEYFFGDRRQALRDAETATALEGNRRVNEVARAVFDYIKAEQDAVSPTYDKWLAQEITWLREQARVSDNYYHFNVLVRLVCRVVGEKYAQAGQPTTSAALYTLVGKRSASEYVDTMKVEHLQQYMDYVNAPAKSELEKVLKPGLKLDEMQMNDLVGTKYLRVCQWDEAIKWLSKVPVSYYNEKGYAVFAANRKYSVEPWITRQWLPFGMEWDHGEIQLAAHPKLTFAREMQRMEGELKVLGGEQYRQRCYDLAVRYAQAHFSGDCWFLMHDGKSIDEVQRPNESDLIAKSLEYLNEAAKSSDLRLKERALFAKTYDVFYKQLWFTMEWNDNSNKYYLKEYPATQHFKAFSEFLKFERTKVKKVSDYVSRCDAYNVFAKRH